jgi:uncharacterized OB-fold protein
MSDADVPSDLPEPLTYEDWAAALHDEVLLGHSCGSCGAVSSVPAAACRDCGAREFETVALPTQGEVVSETTIGVPPTGFPDRYQIAIVAVGKTRVLGGVDGRVDIGDAVELTDVSVVDGDPAPVFATK